MGIDYEALNTLIVTTNRIMVIVFLYLAGKVMLRQINKLWNDQAKQKGE